MIWYSFLVLLVFFLRWEVHLWFACLPCFPYSTLTVVVSYMRACLNLGTSDALAGGSSSDEEQNCSIRDAQAKVADQAT